MHEFTSISRDRVPGVEVRMKTVRLWHFVMCGPPGSPFCEGRYHGTLAIPEAYPAVPPVVVFSSANGRYIPQRDLCLFGKDNWLQAFTLRNVLESVRENFVGPAIFANGVISTVNLGLAKTLAAESRGDECELCGRYSEIALREDMEEPHTHRKSGPSDEDLQEEPGVKLELLLESPRPRSSEELKAPPPVPVATASALAMAPVMTAERMHHVSSRMRIHAADDPSLEPSEAGRRLRRERGRSVSRIAEEDVESGGRRIGEWWYQVRNVALFELRGAITAVKEDRTMFCTLRMLRLTFLYLKQFILTLACKPQMVAVYYIFSMLIMCIMVALVIDMIFSYNLSLSSRIVSIIHLASIPIIVAFKAYETMRLFSRKYMMPAVYAMIVEEVTQIFYFWSSVLLVMYTLHYSEAEQAGKVFCGLFCASQFVRYLALVLRVVVFVLFPIPFLLEYLFRVTCCRPWKGVLAHDAIFDSRLDSEKCVICQGKLQPDQKLIGLGCHENHVFHQECIVAWISRKQECPCCKTLVNRFSHPALAEGS